MGSNVFRCGTSYTGFRVDPSVKFESETLFNIYNTSDNGQSFNNTITGLTMSKSGGLKVTTTGTSVGIGVTGIAQISKAIELDAEIYS